MKRLGRRMQELALEHRDSKLHSERGLARIHVIMIALCAVLIALACVPVYRKYRYHAQWLACADSLRVVNGALVVELLDKGEAESLDKAEKGLVSILPGRKGYCPSGGTIYFIKQKDGEWKAVCGMHDSDHAERTRLNASFVLKQVREKVRNERLSGNKFPQSVTVELNGKPLTCTLVSQEVPLKRGTGTSQGYEEKGTVVYYGLEGHGSFQGTGVSEGQVGYLCFANEEFNARWRVRDSWTGSAYGDRY